MIAGFRCRRGIAALEFALLAPVLMAIAVGTFEVSYAFRIQAKLSTAAGALSELVAVAGAITAPAGTLKDMCVGAKLNLLPFNNQILMANVVSITNDNPGNREIGSTDFKTVKTYLDWENVTDCGKDASGSTPTALGLAGAVAMADTGRSLLTKNGDPSGSSAPLMLNYSVIAVRLQYRHTNVRTNFFSAAGIPLLATAVVKPRAFSATTCTLPASTTACPALQ